MSLPESSNCRQPTVTLRFAELKLSSAGGRVLNVSINGQPVLSNLDIYALAGRLGPVPGLGEALLERDRAFFYSRVVVEQVAP